MTDKNVNETPEIDIENTSAAKVEKLEAVEKNLQIATEKLQQEILNGYRIFTYKDKKYKIKFTSIKDDDILADRKSELITEYLANDILMEEEIVEKLKSKNLWDETKTKRERDLHEQLSQTYKSIYEEKIKKKPSKRRIEELEKERMLQNLELAELTRTKDRLLEASMENKIDNELAKLRATLCIFDAETNMPVWETVEALNSDDKVKVITLIKEARLFWVGLDQSIFEIAPELSL